MSKYTENKNIYLRLKQKGGDDDICVRCGCPSSDMEICTCKHRDGPHESVEQELHGLYPEKGVLNILSKFFMPKVKQIACGPNHALALKTDGTAVMWGRKPGTDSPISFIPHDIQEHIIQIAACGSGDWDNTVALLDDGTLCVWSDVWHVEKILNFGRSRVVQIVCSGTNLIVLLDNNTVRQWKIDNRVEERRIPSFEMSHFTSDGTEENLEDKLNLGLRDELTSVLNEPALFNILARLKDRQIIQIACNSDRAAVLLDDGTVREWTNYGVFTQFKIPSGIQGMITQIACGDYHTIVLLKDGTITGWGRDDQGQISEKPDLRGRRVKQIECGEKHSVALLDDGTVAFWGAVNDCDDEYDDEKFIKEIPEDVLSLIQGRVVQIASASHRVLVLLNDGTIFGWGRDYSVISDIPY